MSDTVIDDPILNSPYDEPASHFKFGSDGITSEIIGSRRPSSYFMPVPTPRKRGQQLAIAELTADQIELNTQVNEIRARVNRWRKLGYPDVTPTSRKLLEYWSDPGRDNPILFCQREASETAIYIAESASKDGQIWIRNHLAAANIEHNDGLPRIALKMATGSGKTVVMAMLIAWQTLNYVAGEKRGQYARRFLVVTPGITIRDRLRVLLPESDDNYYKLRDLVPADLWSSLLKAKIVITNFHALKRQEDKQGRSLAKTTKELLAGGANRPSPFLESWNRMVTRVCRELGGSSGIVVLSDEAHHCYRGRLGDPEADAEALQAEEKKEAKSRNEQARVWFRGLRAVQDKLGVKAVYDLSATPFFLAGSGYREGTLFPWVVSDFSLIDAIESGIVKVPRIPVDDDRKSPDIAYLTLWDEIRDELPKKGRRAGEISPEYLPRALEGALNSLYDSYKKAYEDWQTSEAARQGEPPPVFIVVCNNTTVSKMVYDYISGWKKQVGDHDILVPGKLPLFSNADKDGRWLHRQPTILVDSEILESGEPLPKDFEKIASQEIEEFKAEYTARYPGRSADDIDAATILREVMNTVGKRGKLGEHIRCVVSVSMLTEGWDANTVTHILGVRAFGTQLLCEQVVGRGLRRRSYATDERGFFTPEYADVYGVPFQFIPTIAPTKDIKIKPTRRVRAESDRRHAEITFPRLVGYRLEIPDEELFWSFDADSRLVVDKTHLPTVTETAGVVGATDEHRLESLEGIREQQVAFHLAKQVVERELADPDNPKPWYFPQALRCVQEWLAGCVECRDGTFPGLLMLGRNSEQAASKVWHSILRQRGKHGRPDPMAVPIFRPFDPIGSTADVDFFTIKAVWATSEERCHVNFVVLDGPEGNTWEQTVAQVLENLPQVAAYVKNDHLGFTIPYAFHGVTRQYVPDFLVRLADTGDAVRRTLIVEVSGGHKPPEQTRQKAITTGDLWVPAVNNHGGHGLWSYCEIFDPTKARTQLADVIADLYRLTPGRHLVGPAA